MQKRKLFNLLAVAMILALTLVSVAQAGVQATNKVAAVRTEERKPLPGVDCTQVAAERASLELMLNNRAEQMLRECGLREADSRYLTKDEAAPAPLAPGPHYGSSDIDIINGPQAYPKVTQSSSVVWVEGNTVLVSYNDSTQTSSNPYVFANMSYSFNGGATFTRFASSPLTGLGSNVGNSFVLYNRRLAKWFNFSLAQGTSPNGCGTGNSSNGIGVWQSSNVTSWSAVGCAHIGAADDRLAAWVDNNAGSPYYGRLYVSWNSFLSSPASLNVIYSDNGISWSAPVVINNGNVSFIRNQKLASSYGSDGTVFLYAGAPGSAIIGSDRTHHIYRSTDGGLTWVDLPLNTPIFPAPGELLCQSRLAISPIWRYEGWGELATGPNGSVHYVWAQKGVGSDSSDIYYSRSLDNGNTWSAPSRLNTDATSRTQFRPSLAVTERGGVVASWYDRRNTADNSYQYYSRVSLNNGNNWEAEQPTSDVIIPQPLQPDPQLAACYAGDYDYQFAAGDTTYLAWVDGRTLIGGNPQQNVYFDKIPLVPGRSGLVVGTVSDAASGQPLAAAMITATDSISNTSFNTSSDATGRYTFTLPITPSFTLTATKNLYYPQTVSGVTVISGGTTVRDFALEVQPSGTIAGRVSDATTGQPLQGATVGLTGTGGLVLQVTTPANGTYSFTVPVTDSYNLTVSRSGYQAATAAGVTVITGGTTIRDFALLPLTRCLSYTRSTGSGVTIIPGTTATGNGGDDVVTDLPLPFPFAFYDTDAISLTLSSNGNLQLVSANNRYTNDPLPSTNLNYAIMPHWDDLNTGGNGLGVYTSISGTTPNRIFTIEWRASYFVTPGNFSGNANFEARLYEGSNNIEFIYGTLSGGPAGTENGGNATVGIQKDTGSAFDQFSFNQPVLTSGTRILYTCVPNTLATVTPAPPTNTPILTPSFTPGPATNTPPPTTPSATLTGQPTATAPPSATAPATVTPRPTSTRTPSATPCNLRFSDVPTNYIFFDDIRFLACRGIINGYPNGDGSFRFEPLGNTRRGEFTKIAVNAFAVPPFTPPTPTFNDVPVGNIFYIFVEAAANAGVVNGLSAQQCAGLGTPGRCFGPNVNISRGQAAAIVQRARGYALLTPPTPTFVDVQTDYFAYAAIETLAARGIINGGGCSGGLCFRPNDSILRGELSKVVRRAIESVGPGNGAYLRVIHASNNAPANIDVKLDGRVVIAALPYSTTLAAVSPYLYVPAGSHLVQVTAAGGSAAAISITINFAAGGNYSLYAINQAGGPGVTPLLVNDDLSPPSGNNARVRAVHAAPNAPSVDIYVAGGLLVAGLQYGTASNNLLLAPGTYTFAVHPAGGPSPIFTRTNVLIEPNRIYQLVATGLLGGAPAFDLLLIPDTWQTFSYADLRRRGQ